MSRGRKRLAWTLLAVSAAAFLAIGGPVVADRLITGRDLAPGAVGGRELANGAVSSRKLSRAVRRALGGRAGPAGRNGAPGPQGAQGPQGPAGSRGPAGAMNVLDATGKLLGILTGWSSSNYYVIYTPEGALLQYEPSSSTDYPLTVAPPVLYYRSTDCSGQAYGIWTSAPLEAAIILASTPRAGAPIYVLEPGTSQSFTYESMRSSSPSCTTTRSSTSSLLPARPAGAVPLVQKPFQLAPAG